MKPLIALGAVALLLAGCAKPKTIDGYTYKTYCILNAEERNPDIEYELSIGSVIVAAVLVETVIVPIYVGGFSCMEPIGKRMPDTPKGAYPKGVERK